jgi:hypothetical protein
VRRLLARLDLQVACGCRRQIDSHAMRDSLAQCEYRRVGIGIVLALFIMACHTMNDLYHVGRLNLAIRERFGGDAVFVSLIQDTRMSVVIRDSGRYYSLPSARYSFADSVARFVVRWLDKERLSDLRLVLTPSYAPGDKPDKRARVQIAFVPEYEPDGSVRLLKIDPQYVNGIRPE